MPMLTFIIPVISKEISDNWDLVLANLRKTLTSVKNQTVSNWRVLIVSQTRPDVQYLEDKIIYVHADFKPAHKYLKSIKLSAVKRAVCRRANDLDRVRKIRVAAATLHEYRTDFVMLLEADDLVSNRLCEFVLQNKEANGWSIQKGYTWDGRSSYMLQTNRLAAISGSSWIVKVFYEMLPEDMPIDVDPTTLSLVSSGCPFLDNGHRKMRDGMAQAGKPMQTLPFRGAIYHWGHGVNLSGQCINKDESLSLSGKIRRWWSNVFFVLKNRKNRVYLTESLESEFAIKSKSDAVVETSINGVPVEESRLSHLPGT